MPGLKYQAGRPSSGKCVRVFVGPLVCPAAILLPRCNKLKGELRYCPPPVLLFNYLYMLGFSLGVSFFPICTKMLFQFIIYVVITM